MLTNDIIYSDFKLIRFYHAICEKFDSHTQTSYNATICRQSTAHWHSGYMAHSEMRYLRIKSAKKSMLSIHHVSIMMWLFYIDWEQYCKCDWTMNIGANRNAHGKCDWLDSWASRHCRSIKVVFKSLDCFTVRPTFSSSLITRMKGFFCLFVCFLFVFCWGGGGAQLQCI